MVSVGRIVVRGLKIEGEISPWYLPLLHENDPPTADCERAYLHLTSFWAALLPFVGVPEGVSQFSGGGRVLKILENGRQVT